MSSWARDAAERWLANLALFFALTVACGFAVGLIAALLGDGTIDGQSSTIVTRSDDGTTTSTSTPNDDPAPGLLLLMPVLVVAGSIIFALPISLAWLGAAEVACRLGVPPPILRRIGLGLVALIALSILSGQDGTLYLFMVVGMVAFVALCRLPSDRRRRTKPEQAVTQAQ